MKKKFVDKKLKTEEETSYLKRVEEKYDGYTMENYQKKQNTFGTMAMITNMKDAEAHEIYKHYKSRMEIETAFDSYKNLLKADRTYMQSDLSMNAWVFINHIALMLYYKVFTLIKNKNLLSQISTNDFLLHLLQITKIKINDEWYLSEINSKSKRLFESLGLDIT